MQICPCRVDLISAVLKRKIAIIYADSNQTDVELVGEMCFPNLAFDAQEVQFGSVLNDTTGRHSVLMTNTSKVDAAFDWQFIEVERFDEEEGRHLDTQMLRLLMQPMPGSFYFICPCRVCTPVYITSALQHVIVEQSHPIYESCLADLLTRTCPGTAACTGYDCTCCACRVTSRLWSFEPSAPKSCCWSNSV